MEDNKTLLLFDVDGTLTAPRKKITEEMIETLQKLKTKPNTKIAFVGGSDLHKQEEQLGKENFKLFDYMFPENGLVAYKNQEQFLKENILNFFGEEKLQEFINKTLSYLSQLKLP